MERDGHSLIVLSKMQLSCYKYLPSRASVTIPFEANRGACRVSRLHREKDSKDSTLGKPHRSPSMSMQLTKNEQVGLLSLFDA